MKTNIGRIDRVIRVVVGLGILGAGYYYHNWWGLVGLAPLLTAIVGVCPGYLPFHINTCTKKPDAPA